MTPSTPSMLETGKCQQQPTTPKPGTALHCLHLEMHMACTWGIHLELKLRRITSKGFNS